MKHMTDKHAVRTMKTVKANIKHKHSTLKHKNIHQ